MDETNKKLCKEFEHECWLYIEGSLSAERKQFWKKHISECNECKELTLESVNTIKHYDQLALDDLPDLTFAGIVNRAIEEETQVVIKPFAGKGRSLTEAVGFYKLAFGGGVLLAAIILIIVTFIREPNIGKGLSSEILDWQGDNITKRIEQIEERILSLKSDEWDIYIVRKNKKQNWDATLKNIQNQINDMKKSTNNSEL